MMHAGCDRRMRELQQDRAPPAGDDDRLAIDLPADTAPPGADVPRGEQPCAHSVPMAIERCHLDRSNVMLRTTGLL